MAGIIHSLSAYSGFLVNHARLVGERLHISSATTRRLTSRRSDFLIRLRWLRLRQCSHAKFGLAHRFFWLRVQHAHVRLQEIVIQFCHTCVEFCHVQL